MSMRGGSRKGGGVDPKQVMLLMKEFERKFKAQMDDQSNELKNSMKDQFIELVDERVESLQT